MNKKNRQQTNDVPRVVISRYDEREEALGGRVSVPIGSPARFVRDM